MKKQSKRLISLLMSVVMLFSVFSSVSVAYAGSSYNSDYRRWSQGKSAYADMRSYGCLVVAMAKMIRESDIKTSGFNPDTLYNWFVSNKYLKNMYMQSFEAPVAYAKAVGNNRLTYKGVSSSDILNKAKSNAKSGYYSIIHVTGSNHYFIVDNKTTNSKGSVYIYDSWNSQNDPSVPMSISTTAHGSTVYTKRLAHIYTYSYGAGSNSGSSSSSFKNPSVTVKGASSITNSSARIDFTANNPSGLTIRTVGVQIRKKGDSSWLVSKSEAVDPNYVNYTSIKMWWTIGKGKELNVALSPGTTYEYRAYAVYNGNNYYSSMSTFTTSGSHSHSWGSATVIQSATCTTAGTRRYTCSGCGAYKTESIPATGHKFQAATNIQPVCTEGGQKVSVCSVCGYRKTENIAAKEHKFGEWEVTKEATCEENGEQVRKCSVCKFEEKQEIPAEHKFENGYCTVCGAEEDKFDDNYYDDDEQTTPPARATVKKLQSKKRTVIAYWGKISDARGYQIQVATDKKFKKNKKTFSIENQKASKKTIKNLKAKKKYYVRVRAYRYSYFGDGERAYGSWSKVKSVKTK